MTSYEPGEEDLTPEERLRKHTARQVIEPEKAPTWWEHWVSNLRAVANLLNEDGKVWRPRARRWRFEDVFLALWLLVFALWVVVAVVVL